MEQPRASEKDNAFRQFSLNGNLWLLVLKISAPLAFYQIVNWIFGVYDTFLASQFSSDSVTAVVYLNQLAQMLSAIGAGLSVGASLRISEAFGAGDDELVQQRVSTLYAVCLGIGLTLLAVILPFTDPFLRMAGTSASISAIGRSYFIVQMLILVVQFLNNVYISVERARGNIKRLTLLNFMVVGIKFLLSNLFVYGMHGTLVTIAVATLLSQLALLGVAIYYTVRTRDIFSFHAGSIRFDRRVLLPMLTRAAPVTAEKLLFNYGKVAINAMSMRYGNMAVGALGVSNNMGGISVSPQSGVQEGGAAVISQNIGAGNYRRARQAFLRILVIEVSIGVALMVVSLLFLEPLAAIFDGGDATFRHTAMEIYRYEAIGCPALGVNAAVLSLLYGMGDTRTAMLLNIARIFVFRIPVLWVLQCIGYDPIASLGLVMLISNLGTGLSALAILPHFWRTLKQKEVIPRGHL